jgi:hypothetical protein
MADVATNLLRLNEWVTVPDAAKYLSGKLGTTILDSDLLLWAKNKRLQMSILFDIVVRVKFGEIFPLKGSEKRKFNTKLASVLLGDDDPQVFLRHTEPTVQMISNLCDFISFNGDPISTSQPSAQDVIEIIYTYPNPAGGQDLELPVESGVFVTREGLTALLPEEYGPDSWRHHSQLVIRIDVLEKFVEAQSDQSSPDQQNATQNPSKDPCSAFRNMQNLTADEISITFVGDKNEYGIGANNLLEISARGTTKNVALAEIGLINKHSGHLNDQCAILLGMAQKNNLPYSAANSKKISRLRGMFRSHLNCIDEPFDPYRTAVGWNPRFRLRDNRGAADLRAKREAERRTSSLEQLQEKGTQFAQDDQTQSFEGDDADDADDANEWLKNHNHDSTS